MKLQMSPGLWIALLVCAIGLGVQFLSKGETVSMDQSKGPSKWASFSKPGKTDDTIVKSSRKRVMSERKAYFPFDDLYLLQRIYSQDQPRSDVERFLKGSPEARSAFIDRRKLFEQVEKNRAEGLGQRHPTVILISDQMTELEDLVRKQWKVYQDQRRKSADERKPRRAG